MQAKQGFGFIFDVDGVLTIPINKKNPRSIIDSEIVPYLEKILELKFPLAFVTGRSLCWIANNLLTVLPESIIEYSSIYMEYGLVLYDKNSDFIVYGKNDFRKIFYNEIISEVESICLKENVLFEKDKTYCDPPPHGGLWIEDKKIMLSFGSNLNVPPKKIHSIINNLNLDLRKNLRIVNHHLGTDILPLGWSKENATKNFKDAIKISKNVTKWYIFGDNKSDEEMCKPFENFEFINTKIDASELTKRKLKILIFSSSPEKQYYP